MPLPRGMGAVMVELTALARDVPRGCDRIEVLVNDVPTAGTDVEAQRDGGKGRVRGQRAFQTFEPLTKKYPSFAVRACGSSR